MKTLLIAGFSVAGLVWFHAYVLVPIAAEFAKVTNVLP